MTGCSETAETGYVAHPAQGTPGCYVEGSVEATGTSSARVLARLLSPLAPSHGQLGTQCAGRTGCVFAQGAWSPAWDKGPLCPQASWLVLPHRPIHTAPPPSLPCDPLPLSTVFSPLSMRPHHLGNKSLCAFNSLRPPRTLTPTYTLPSPPPRMLPSALPSSSPPSVPKSGHMQHIPTSSHILMRTPDSCRSHSQAHTHPSVAPESPSGCLSDPGDRRECDHSRPGEQRSKTLSLVWGNIRMRTESSNQLAHG